MRWRYELYKSNLNKKITFTTIVPIKIILSAKSYILIHFFRILSRFVWFTYKF